MRAVCFLITIECPDETTNEDMDKLRGDLEDLIFKNNYELYSSEWYDE